MKKNKLRRIIYRISVESIYRSESSDSRQVTKPIMLLLILEKKLYMVSPFLQRRMNH